MSNDLPIADEEIIPGDWIRIVDGKAKSTTLQHANACALKHAKEGESVYYKRVPRFR